MLQHLLSKLETHPILIIAHRGASGDFAENTMEAFEKAVELGADMIELDVQITKDKQIICYHDDTLNHIKINELDFDKIENKNIPLLFDVLDKLHDKIYFIIELKQAHLFSTEPLSTDILNDISIGEKSIINCNSNTTLSSSIQTDIVDTWLPVITKYDLFGKVIFVSENLQYLSNMKHALGNQLFYCAVITSDMIDNCPNEIQTMSSVICSITELEAVRQIIQQTATSEQQLIGVYGVKTKADIALCLKYNVRFIGTDYPAEIRKLLSDSSFY